jgi:hypothetical protein
VPFCSDAGEVAGEPAAPPSEPGTLEAVPSAGRPCFRCGSPLSTDVERIAVKVRRGAAVSMGPPDAYPVEPLLWTATFGAMRRNPAPPAQLATRIPDRVSPIHSRP